MPPASSAERDRQQRLALVFNNEARPYEQAPCANEYKVYARGNKHFRTESPAKKPSLFALTLGSKIKLR